MYKKRFKSGHFLLNSRFKLNFTNQNLDKAFYGNGVFFRLNMTIVIRLKEL